VCEGNIAMMRAE